MFGGAERYALELATYMADVAPTRLVTFGQEGREKNTGRLSIRVLGGAWYVRGQRTNPLAAGLLREILRADVIHCHQQHVLASSLVALAGSLARRKVFVTNLGGGGWDLSAYVSTDRLYRGHLHISDYSRAVGGQSAKSWAHVIYGGVDTEHFHPSETGASNGRVLFIGRLMPHKGIDDLIAALPPGLSLDIIGRPYNAEYAAHLRNLAEGKDVVFRHDCTDEQIAEAYRSALCTVLPSVYRTMYGQTSAVPELLGQTLLEGMASGRPAICTDVASMPEIVRDGVTGFIVPPNNPSALREKLEWLKANPGRSRADGSEGAARHSGPVYMGRSGGPLSAHLFFLTNAYLNAKSFYNGNYGTGRFLSCRTPSGPGL